MAKDESNDVEISRFEFETQARRFDARAGLGPRAARAVGETIARLVGIDVSTAVLEVGAGTGEVGVTLASKTRGYVGLDLSPAMLDVFRERASGLAPRLVAGDANSPWPVPDRALEGLYLARVLHLLDPAHVRAEIDRVASERGLAVLVGRRRRAPDSPASRVRRLLHERLAEQGIEPRRGERAERAFVDAYVGRGAEPILAEVAAETTVTSSLGEALARFRSKSGLSGRDLPRPMHDAILDDVERTLRDEGADLDAAVPSVERFVVEGFRFRR